MPSIPSHSLKIQDAGTRPDLETAAESVRGRVQKIERSSSRPAFLLVR